MRNIQPTFSVRSLFFLISILFSVSASAQEEGNPDYVEYKKQKEEKKEKEKTELSEYSFAERCYWGGSLSLSLGNYGSYIDISPILGYNLTMKWSAGIGVSYKYFGGRNQFYGVTYSTSVYGGCVFTRLLMGEKFFAHAELESLNTDAYDPLTLQFKRKFINIGAAGLGFRNEMGYNRYFYFMLLYDFINDRDSPYPFSPFIVKAGAIFPISDR
ncbi:MAG: hypothetical protein ACK40M_10600 [Flavobacteriales bacterium]